MTMTIVPPNTPGASNVSTSKRPSIKPWTQDHGSQRQWEKIHIPQDGLPCHIQLVPKPDSLWNVLGWQRGKEKVR